MASGHAVFLCVLEKWNETGMFVIFLWRIIIGKIGSEQMKNTNSRPEHTIEEVQHEYKLRNDNKFCKGT